MRRVLTIGTFDLFHLGHLRLLERAAEFGDLEVGVNSNAFVEKYKGQAPVAPWGERAEIVRALRCVAQVWFNDGPGRDLIIARKPDLLVIGMDWHTRYNAQIDVDTRELDEWGIGVVYLPRTPGVSTTERRAS